MSRAFIHPKAEIGNPPESRDYWADPSAPTFEPVFGHDARVHAFVTVDAGLKRSTQIGHRTALMAHVHVGHDAIIGDDCELAPGVIICGHVMVGNGVRFGVGAVVRPFIKIGALARIGAGAVVIRDVPPGQTWAGNPAKQIRTKGAFVPHERAKLESEWERYQAQARSAEVA